jgi:hypothetical protein
MAFTSIEDLIKNSSGLGPSLAMNAPVEAPPGEIPLALRDANPQPIAPPPPPMAKAPAPKKKAQKEVSEPAVKEEEAPQEAPNPYADLMVTKDDLEKAADAKKKDIGLGMMMDALANRQSWGNFYSGKMGPHHDVTSGFKQMAEMEDQPIKNKQLLLAQELKRPETEMQARMTDPNSVESKLSRDLAVAGISKLNLPGETKQKLLESIKSANALQVNSLVDKNPMLKDVFQQDAMGQRLAMMSAALQQRTALGYDRLELARDKAGSSAGQAIEHDPIVMQAKKTTNNLDRALSILDGKEPVTAKSFAILQQDMINAMAPGGAATEGKVNREMVHTLQEKLNDIALHYGKRRGSKKSSA